MKNNIDLYDELKSLESIVDKKIEDKKNKMQPLDLPEGRVKSLRRWIFNWFD
jgi:hypothetical protein